VGQRPWTSPWSAPPRGGRWPVRGEVLAHPPDPIAGAGGTRSPASRCPGATRVVGPGPRLEHRRTGAAASGGWGRKPPVRAGGAEGAGTRPWPLHPVGVHGNGVDGGPRAAPPSPPRKPPATPPTGQPAPGETRAPHRPERQGYEGLGPPLCGGPERSGARSSLVGGPPGAAESPSSPRFSTAGSG
jgi:hypothetical protein